MIILICSILLLIALVVLYFLKINRQILLMTIIVGLIIVLNFSNQISIENQRHAKSIIILSNGQQTKTNVYTISIMEEKEQLIDRMKELIQQEKHIVGYLEKKCNAGEDMVIHFQNMHKNRLKLVINQLKYNLNQTSPSPRPNNKKTTIAQMSIDFANTNCNYECFSSSISSIKEGGMVYLFVDNAAKAQQFQQLREVYLNKNLTIILLSIPKEFNIFPLSQLTTIYQFSNNYLQKMLQNHPSKVIQQCANYRTFDYNLYIASLYEPLIDLCSTRLPSTQATQCIRGYMTDPAQQLPYSLVKHCLTNQSDGIIIRNGFVSLQRDYYWAGRVDQDAFTAFKRNQTKAEL